MRLSLSSDIRRLDILTFPAPMLRILTGTNQTGKHALMRSTDLSIQILNCIFCK